MQRGRKGREVALASDQVLLAALVGGRVVELWWLLGCLKFRKKKKTEDEE